MKPADLTRCDRGLLARLKALTDDSIEKATGDSLLKGERQAGTNRIVRIGELLDDFMAKHKRKQAARGEYGTDTAYKTESAVNKVQGDVFLGNDQYLIELHRNAILEKWRPPAPELGRMKRDAFVQQPEGYWWPVQISAQGLLVNTRMVPEGSIK